MTLERHILDADLLDCCQMNNTPAMVEKKYRVYLLRLWRGEAPAGSGWCASWRASLDDPRTGERIGFESLECLFAFLMEQIERESIS